MKNYSILDTDKVQTFSQDALKDTTDQMREGCYDVSRTVVELEKDKKTRLERKAEEEKRRWEEDTAAEPVRRKRSGSKEQDEVETGEVDQDYMPKDEDKPISSKRVRKTTSLQALLAPDTREYHITAADREEHIKQRSDDKDMPDSTQPPEQEETEEESRKKQLEHEIEAQEKELRRMEWRKQHTEEECSKQKAREFQKVIQAGAWVKEQDRMPKIVSTEKQKKSKGFILKSVSTTKDDDNIHCRNIRKADGFQHYVKAICQQFEAIVRKAGNVPINYGKLVKSIYWAYQAVWRNHCFIIKYSGPWQAQKTPT